MFKDPKNSFYDSHDVYAQPRKTRGADVAPIQTKSPEMPAHKIAAAVRRIALLELGHLTEDRIRLPFAVAPRLLAKPGDANWKILISKDAADVAVQALLNAEMLLQPRWNMVDSYQDSRALIV